MKVMRYILLSYVLFLSLAGPCWAEACPSRSIFLNGLEISGATNQELKNIDMHLDERGDIYLNAPHYQVYEEDHYLPLGAQNKIEDAMTHNAKMALPPAVEEPASASLQPLSQPKPLEIEQPSTPMTAAAPLAKAGSKTPAQP